MRAKRLRLVGGAAVTIVGVIVFVMGAFGVLVVEENWNECHDPEFLVDFEYLCRGLNFTVLLVWSFTLSGAALIVIGALVVIDPRQKRWEPPESLIT